MLSSQTKDKTVSWETTGWNLQRRDRQPGLGLLSVHGITCDECAALLVTVHGITCDCVQQLIAALLGGVHLLQVAEAMCALQAHGLNPESVHAMDAAVLDSMIIKVGFHNNKTKYIKQATARLIEEHGADVPQDIEALLALPGIGQYHHRVNVPMPHSLPGMGTNQF